MLCKDKDISLISKSLFKFFIRKSFSDTDLNRLRWSRGVTLEGPEDNLQGCAVLAGGCLDNQDASFGQMRKVEALCVVSLCNEVAGGCVCCDFGGSGVAMNNAVGIMQCPV